MRQWVDEVRVSWQTTADGPQTVEVILGKGTPAVMTPELAAELMYELDVHLGHIRRFKKRREAPKPG